MKMRIAAIIPARGGSKRLPLKNIFPVAGKPMIIYAIEACKKSKFIDEVFVSSDDERILKIGEQNSAIPLKRDEKQSGDTVPKIHAVRAAAEHPGFKAKGPWDIIVIPQANSPELTSAMLDAGIEFLIENNLWEVMSADRKGIQNAAFRIIRTEHLFNDFLSAHCGFVVAECSDVHSLEDVGDIEKKWKGKNGN